MNVLVVLLLRFWQGRGDAGGERAAAAAAGEADATRSEVSNASLGT